MGRRLIIDEDSVYEIDEMCMKIKERGNADSSRQSQSRNTAETGNRKTERGGRYGKPGEKTDEKTDEKTGVLRDRRK